MEFCALNLTESLCNRFLASTAPVFLEIWKNPSTSFNGSVEEGNKIWCKNWCRNETLIPRHPRTFLKAKWSKENLLGEIAFIKGIPVLSWHCCWEMGLYLLKLFRVRPFGIWSQHQLGFCEIQAELTNLPILPNSLTNLPN